MRAVLILFNIEKINKEYLNNAFIIGVDRGALNAINQGINLDISIGDFDSVNDNEFELIKNNSKKIIKLNRIKDETDTLEAINLVKNYDEIIILGGIKGKRIEHFYSNLILLNNYNNIKMIDDNSLIEIKKESFKPYANYQFVSFFSLDDNTIISLVGFKYNLSKYNLKRNDPLCISNEIINNPYVTLEGKIMVIYTNEA